MSGPPIEAVEQGEVTPDAIMQLGFAFWGSKTLLSAVELGVFSELADAGPLDANALRDRLGVHPRSAADFFDALVALGMLEREDGRYANAAATDLFFSTGPSLPTSVASWRWRMPASIHSGDR